MTAEPHTQTLRDVIREAIPNLFPLSANDLGEALRAELVARVAAALGLDPSVPFTPGVDQIVIRRPGQHVVEFRAPKTGEWYIGHDGGAHLFRAEYPGRSERWVVVRSAPSGGTA